MSKVIIWHKVKDYDAWKKEYDDDLPRREAAGIKEVGIQRGKMNGNLLLIEFEGAPGSVEKMLADPGLKAKLETAGVEGFDYFPS